MGTKVSGKALRFGVQIRKSDLGAAFRGARQPNGKRKKCFAMSKTTELHLIKLILRTVMLLAWGVLLVQYHSDPRQWGAPRLLLGLYVWLSFMLEMLRRLFPIRRESVGCQKQYAHTYQPAEGKTAAPALPHRRALAVALFWTAVTAAIGRGYLRGCYGEDVLMLFSLFFAVCDMICVLVFCPFQKWIMKNRCCVTCRIYDWDYAMMFAPLVFVPKFETRSLFGMGLVLLLKWEITVFRHPERFDERTNASLSCKNCTEKLCRHKFL